MKGQELVRAVVRWAVAFGEDPTTENLFLLDKSRWELNMYLIDLEKRIEEETE